MGYLIHILTVLGLYVILASSLGLVAGHAGLLSIGHAAFFGLGAYASAILAIGLGFPTLLSAVLAVSLCSLVAGVLGVLILRTRGDLFAIATFCFQVVAFNVANNWTEVTGGPIGVIGIPPLSIGGVSLRSSFPTCVLVWCIALGSVWACATIVRSRMGRVLHGLREDELLLSATGRAVGAFKMRAFVVSAALAGAAGVLFAHYMTYIDPKSFTVWASIAFLTFVIVGGADSVLGVALGAITLGLLPEVLRFVGLPPAVAGDIRQLLFGAALIVVMLWRPQGIFGHYSFGRVRGST